MSETTFTDVIALWPSTADFAGALGVPYQTAAAWKRRNSIPPDQWLRLVTAAREIGQELSLETLAAAARPRAAAFTPAPSAEDAA